jgi:defect-in-organelle-trafficking protein DotD
VRNKGWAYKRLKNQANQGQRVSAMHSQANRIHKFMVMLCAVTLLAACEGTNTTSVTPIATEPDIVTAKLAQAADKASHALDTISGIEQQRAPATPAIEDYTNAPPNLTQPITIRWSGPIEKVAKVLADRAGYRFRTKGSAPPVPLSVNIDVYQQPLIHVLRDLGLQAGQRADLAVDAQSGVVEIRYAPADKS